MEECKKNVNTQHELMRKQCRKNVGFGPDRHRRQTWNEALEQIHSLFRALTLKYPDSNGVRCEGCERLCYEVFFFMECLVER